MGLYTYGSGDKAETVGGDVMPNMEGEKTNQNKHKLGKELIPPLSLLIHIVQLFPCSTLFNKIEKINMQVGGIVLPDFRL